MKKIQNHVQVIGRLGAAPEVKVLENGKRYARFSVAVSNSYTTRAGEKVTDVQWHTVLAWGILATVAERLLQKGTQLTVDGRLSNRSYTNRDGYKITVTEIIADELFVLQNRSAA
jgi:single-strand DNA-binding protein